MRFPTDPYHKVILQLRLRAMYGQDRTLSILLGSTFIITKLWIIIQSGFFAAALEGLNSKLRFMMCFSKFILVTSTPLPGLSMHFCVQLNSWRYYYLYWAPLIFFESLLFLLALYKGYQCYRSADPSTAHLNRTINFLVRDSVWYFITYAIHDHPSYYAVSNANADIYIAFSPCTL